MALRPSAVENMGMSHTQNNICSFVRQLYPLPQLAFDFIKAAENSLVENVRHAGTFGTESLIENATQVESARCSGPPLTVWLKS